MDFGTLLEQFANDDKVKAVLVLIAVDFIIGVCAAISTKKFRLSYIGDFLRKDILGKVLPWFVLYAAGKVSDQDLPGGVTLSSVADVAFGIIALALGGSILKSLGELGLLGDSAKKAAQTDPSAPTTARAVFGPEELPTKPG